MSKSELRLVWVDNVKVLACILVVLGHFFQSMTKSAIIMPNCFTEWFDETIYFFHVELFFICSGYLYQKYSRVNTLSEWKESILKKFLALGVPYFTFTIITWIIKTIFSGSVNSEIGGFTDTLFLHPTAPYWYLYSLFFIFLITPTSKNKKTMLLIIVIALFFKLLNTFLTIPIYAISSVMSNEIWFVIGIYISSIDVKNIIYVGGGYKTLIIGSILGVSFILLSIILYFINITNPIIEFVMGIVACFSIILIFMYIYKDNRNNRFMSFLSKYTMPIFLMHTLFAATVRIFLMKLGIVNTLIHIVLGILVSFAGPIIAVYIMEKFKYMDFLLYPTRYIKLKSK